MTLLPEQSETAKPVEHERRVLAPDVAVLFARADSVYKTLPGADVYDAERDALTWMGGCPAVVHPPCRRWGTMAHLSTAPEVEMALAIRGLEMVRTWGGVLEHPAASRLWAAAKLPTGRAKDRFGGWTLTLDQYAFGHPANKSTRLYIVGCAPADLPPLPLVLGEAYKRITTRRGMIGRRCTQQEREHTPLAFAQWLLSVARTCRSQNTQRSGDTAD